MASSARLLRLVWQLFIAVPTAQPPKLPDELWWSIGSFLAAQPMEDPQNYGCLSVAICEAHLDIAKLPDPKKTEHHTLIITRQHTIAVVAIANTSAIRHLQIAMDAPLYCCSQWRLLLGSFANVVSLDLSRVVDRRACDALLAASQWCRHVRALALPSQPLSEVLAQDVIETTAVALRRWRKKNGGLRFLSLGRAIYHRSQGHCLFAAVARFCRRIEFLYVPEGAVLRNNYPTVYAALWRSCVKLRDSNCSFPIRTCEDFDALVASPKPQLVHASFSDLRGVYGHPSVLLAFARAFPSLRSIRLQAHSEQNGQVSDTFIRHALLSCPRLESVAIAAATSSHIHPSHPFAVFASWYTPLVSTLGVVALARCARIKVLRVERVSMARDTLVDIAHAMLFESPQATTRSIELTVIHFDWRTLSRFLEFWKTVSIAALSKRRFMLRVRNRDARVNEQNRACDKARLQRLVHDVKERLPDNNVLRLRIDLVSDKANLVVAAVAVFVNTTTGLDGIFIDGIESSP